MMRILELGALTAEAWVLYLCLNYVNGRRELAFDNIDRLIYKLVQISKFLSWAATAALAPWTVHLLSARWSPLANLLVTSLTAINVMLLLWGSGKAARRKGREHQGR